MIRNSDLRRAAMAAAAILPWFVASAAEPPAPVKVEGAVKATVQVVAVDQSKREVTVKDPKSGETVTLEVSPDVRNFAQVKVGDNLNVVYYVAIGAEFKKPGTGVQGIQQNAASTTAPAGAKPAGMVGQQVKATVKINSVDAANNMVSFTGPKGVKRTVAVKDPKAREFVKQLKPGDDVELTYTEALAISVEEAPPAK